MRTLVLGYTAFLCCFFFPLGSSPPLHRVILFGLMVLCLVEAYGPGRERDVFFRVLAAAAAGLLVRYLLEYGEVSNTRTFTAENVLFFLLSSRHYLISLPIVSFIICFITKHKCLT